MTHTNPLFIAIVIRCVAALTAIKVGAGIQIPPNSSRHLHDWGLGPRLDAVAVHPGAMIFRRWENGKVIGLTDLGPSFRSRFHAPYYVIHRANFHEVLHARAEELGVHIKLGSKVATYDAEIPSAILDDGQVLTADLIVAADGEIESALTYRSRLIITQVSIRKR